MNHQTHLFSAYRWLNPMFGLAHSFQAQKATMSPVCHWTRIPPSSYRLTLKARSKQQPHAHPLQCSLFACPFSASNFLMRTCQPCHIMPSVLYNCLSHFVVAVFFVRPPPTVAALPTSKHRRAKWRWTQSHESWTPVQPSKCLKLLNKTEITMWKVGVKNTRKGSNMIQYDPICSNSCRYQLEASSPTFHWNAFYAKQVKSEECCYTLPRSGIHVKTSGGSGYCTNKRMRSVKDTEKNNLYRT